MGKGLFAIVIWWFCVGSLEQNLLAQELGTQQPHQQGLKHLELDNHFLPAQRFIEKQEIEWQEMGPWSKPVEGFTGGKAIPTYAVGRGNGIGRVNALFIHPRHPSTLYACSATGGVFVSHDKGRHWSSGGTDQLTHSGVGALALHSRKVNWWIAATGDSENNNRVCDTLVLTCDGGVTFQSVIGNDPATALPIRQYGNDGASDFFIRKLCWEQTNANRLWVISNRGLWLCENLVINRKGRLQQNPTWKRVMEGDFYDFAIIQKGKHSAWYVAGSSLFLADDNPYIWKPMAETGLHRNEWGGEVRFTLQANPYLPNFLYVNGTSVALGNDPLQSISVLYLVDVKKQNWQRLHSSVSDNIGISNMRPRAWSVHPNNPNRILMADVHPVYFSLDGGKSFKKSVTNQMHDDVHSIVYSPDGKLIYAAHDGGVAMSDDGGVQWTDRSNGLGCANVFDLQVHPNGSGELLFGAFDTGINSLKGDTHTHLIWGDGFDCAYINDGKDKVAAIQYGRFYSTDSLGNFESGKSPNVQSEWKTNLAVHPLDHQCIVLPGRITKRSMDGGLSWTPITLQLPDSSQCIIYDVFLSPFAKNIALAYGMRPNHPERPRLFLSPNLDDPNSARVQWTEIADLPFSGIVTGVVFHPIAPNQFWLLTSNRSPQGKFWFYDGANWFDESANLGDARCESIVLNTASMVMVIGSDQGVFCRSLHNSKFRCYTGFPGCQVKAMAIDYRKRHLYIGTFGRGIWRCNLQTIQPDN